MAQHSEREPVSDAEYDQMEEKIREHFQEIRELLAEDFGGESKDYDHREETDTEA